MVDSFTKETATNTITEEQVTKLYDKVLFNLGKKKYLTKDEVEKIKQDPSYAAQAKETATLINTNSPGLEGKDKMYYKVASFAKAIGLSGISNHCLQKITPEKLEKISTIETALSHRIKSSIGKHNNRLEKVAAKMPEKSGARAR